MFRALVLGFGQLSDPRTRKILWISIAGSIVALAALLALAGWGVTAAAETGYAWLDLPLEILGGLASIYVAWLLFPAITVVISSLFLERVSVAVESRWYPALPPPPGSTLARDVGSALRFALLALALNILALPIYLWLPGFSLVVFYLLNGYLLGREYYEQIAARRLAPAAVKAGWRAGRPRLWVAGGLIALISSVPLLNLLAPIVATAFMTHMFEDLRRRQSLA